MDLLDGLGIDDSTLAFRIAVLEDASGRSLGISFDWPAIAAQSLAEGLDTPALVVLASAYADADSITLRELVQSAADSIGLGHPSPAEAIRAMGMIVNRAFMNDSITPVLALSVVSRLTECGSLDWDLYCAYAPIFDWDELPELRDEIVAAVQAGVRDLNEEGDGPLAERIIKLTGPRVSR